MSIELHDTSLKFLNKSMYNLQNNRPINFDLLKAVSSKYHLVSPYNTGAIVPMAIASYTGKQKVDPAQVERITDLLAELIRRARAKKAAAGKSGSTPPPAGSTPPPAGSTPPPAGSTPPPAGSTPPPAGGPGPTGYGPTGYSPTGYGPTGYGPTGYGPTGYGPTGYGPTGYGSTGYGPTGPTGTGAPSSMLPLTSTDAKERNKPILLF